MNRATVLMSRNDRLAFIQKLQAKYNISQKETEAVQNITTMGVAYLSIRMPGNEVLVLEFLSDNVSRYGYARLFERNIKKAEGVLKSGEIPDLFKPYMDAGKIVFDVNDMDLSSLMEVIAATPTAREADALSEEQVAPAASPSVLTTLFGLFKRESALSPVIKTQEALSRGNGVQDWQNSDIAKNAVNAGPSFRPHSGSGNDDL